MLRRDSTQRSFFDQGLYDRLIGPEHFLRQLAALVDWRFAHRICKGCYARDLGRPGGSPGMLFKILLLQFLYDISDRRIMEEVYLQMAFKWFCGLEPDEATPHPTTLTHFRSRLGPERFARIHNRIVELARERGLVSDRLSVVDATHVASRMNSFRVDEENPPDPDARRGGRGGGQVFVGYKAHLALDADSRIITKEEATPANVNEGRELPRVLEKNALRVTADKAYDTNRNHNPRPSMGRQEIRPLGPGRPAQAPPDRAQGLRAQAPPGPRPGALLDASQGEDPASPGGDRREREAHREAPPPGGGSARDGGGDRLRGDGRAGGGPERPPRGMDGGLQAGRLDPPWPAKRTAHEAPGGTRASAGFFSGLRNTNER